MLAERSVQYLFCSRSIVWMDGRGPGAIGGRSLRGKAQQSFGSSVQMQFAGQDIVIPGAEAGSFVGEIECLPAPAELLLDPFVLGQIMHFLGKSAKLPLPVEHAGQ